MKIGSPEEDRTTEKESGIMKKKVEKELDTSVLLDGKRQSLPEDCTIWRYELPPVDYSGYSKNELVETLGLIIENRPPSK